MGAAALLAYALWTLAGFRAGHDARDFILIGKKFLLQSHVSKTIRLDPRYHYLKNNVGYDGQFAYYIALDPVNARYYLDTHGKYNADPDYRYTRILYPALARTLALGNPDLIPYTLILVNWLAIAGGTLAVAVWLARRRVSPWLALIYAFYPGLVLVMERDLNEVLAFGLVALGVLLLDRERGGPTIPAAIAFALAGLSRETTAVFPLVYGVGMALPVTRSRRDGRLLKVALFLGIALLPLILWKLFLFHWLHSAGRAGGNYPTLLPFGGILSYWPWHGSQLEEVIGVIIPALICAGMSIWALLRRLVTVEVWILVVNILVFVVFLNPFNYINIAGSGRVTTGVVLGALYCIPIFDRLTGGNRWWLWTASAFWFFSLPALEPLWHTGVQTIDLLLVPGFLGITWLLSRVTSSAVEAAA